MGGGDIQKEALFHCADEMVREAVGRTLEVGLYDQNVQVLLPRALKKYVREQRNIRESTFSAGDP